MSFSVLCDTPLGDSIAVCLHSILNGLLFSVFSSSAVLLHTFLFMVPGACGQGFLGNMGWHTEAHGLVE